MGTARRASLGVTALALAAATVSANAANVNNLVQNGANTASDENREYLLDRDFGGGGPGAGTVGQIDVGDALRGMININTLNSSSGNIGGSTGVDELTAVFQFLVTGKVDLGGGTFSFTFGPDPAWAANVATPGTMVVLYTDAANNFAGDFDDPSGAPVAVDDGVPGSPSTPPLPTDVSVGPYASEEAMIGTAGDGLVWANLGFTGAGGTSAAPSAAAGEGGTGVSTAGDNILASFGIASGVGFVLNNFGLSLLSTGAGWDPGISINQVTAGAFGATDFAVFGSTNGVNDLDTPFEASSNFTVSFNATVVPEPSAVVVVGLGLLGIGLAGVRNRRRRSAG